MKYCLFLRICTCATLTSIALLEAAGTVRAQNLPAYMEPIAGITATSPTETATKNMLALNSGMFEL
jgi:hypothetical protein